MSNSLDEYKKEYQNYLDIAVKLHNYHLAFSNNWGEESHRMLRQNARRMKVSLKMLLRLAKVAFKDYKVIRKNLRELKKQEKLQKEQEEIRLKEERKQQKLDEIAQQIAWRKANPRKKGRPKGSKTNVKHNRTTKNSP